MHTRWLLQQRCYYTSVYNSTQCAELYELLPTSWMLSLTHYHRQRQRTAKDKRWTHALRLSKLTRMAGILRTYDDPVTVKSRAILRRYGLTSFSTGITLVKSSVFQITLSLMTTISQLGKKRYEKGDQVQRAQLLYIPLLEAGIRVLHYIGYRDAVCA